MPFFVEIFLCCLVLTSISAKEARPNIVIFLADDLGYGDIGIFGNTTLRTPNIDSIAKQGVRLSHHMAASSVCTPSRAAFLTGRYPIRSGMAPLMEQPGRVTVFTGSSAGLPPNETTFAEIAKKAGYKTAIIGKWHLGVNRYIVGDNLHHPLNQGFDYFYGLPLTNMQDFGEGARPLVYEAMPYFMYTTFANAIPPILFIYFLYHFGIIGKKLTFLAVMIVVFAVLYYTLIPKNLKFLNSMLMRNHEVVEMPIDFENLTQRLVTEGQEFIQERSRNNEPFLLFMSWVQVHTHLHTSKDFAGKSKHGQYGDNVEEMDWSVGEIMKTMDSLGLRSNTLVYFSSDNGPHVEDVNENGEREGGISGIFRGGKFQGGMEGGIRMPSAIMMPGKIPANQELAEPTSQMDFLPTISSLLDVPLPDDRVIDGRDMMPLLTGNESVSPHEFMFHYCRDQIHAVRHRPLSGSEVWKIRYATPKYNPGTEGCGFMCDCGDDDVTRHDPPLLFNIQKDLREENPVNTDEPQYKAILDVMQRATENHKDSIDNVEKQFQRRRFMWLPWLQPVCNFPRCTCTDQKYSKNS